LSLSEVPSPGRSVSGDRERERAIQKEREEEDAAPPLVYLKRLGFSLSLSLSLSHLVGGVWGETQSQGRVFVR